MVVLKVAIIVLFILAGVAFVDTSNWMPYVPQNTGKFGEFGWSGVLQGAGIIFFSYIGFDAASTTAREARNPQRDVPARHPRRTGHLGHPLRCNGGRHDGHGSVHEARRRRACRGGARCPSAACLAGWIVKLGAIAGMTSVILMSLLGQPRILLSMAEDGLLPKAMSKVHPTYRTPHVATAWTVVIAAAFAGLLPLDVLGELISIGILLAFVAVCLGVLVLRYTKPDMPRPFRVPLAPVHLCARRRHLFRHDAFPAGGHLVATWDLVTGRPLDLCVLRLSPQPSA